MPGESPLHVVLISLDTVRADVAYSGRFPSIERLRRQGATFAHTVSSSPITPVSHASVLTGLQPPRHGLRHLLREQLSSDARTLAQVFSEAGYTTGAIVSCPGLNAWYGFDRGFTHYDDSIPPLSDGRDPLAVIDVELRGTALKRAPLVVERALDWVRGAGSGPLFLFVHFFDAHWPYEAPERPPIQLANPYEEEVWYMDHYLGKLLDGLIELGMTPQNTTFVLFSDHGEDLAGWYDNDHAGDQGHAEEKGHGCLLFDTTQKVALVICAAGVADPGSVLADQVRLIDVMPTIQAIARCNGSRAAVDGRSLLPLLQGDRLPLTAAYCEAFYREELASVNPAWSHLLPLKAIRTPCAKVIWEIGSDRVESYDLRSDPNERNPGVLVP